MHLQIMYLVLFFYLEEIKQKGLMTNLRSCKNAGEQAVFFFLEVIVGANMELTWCQSVFCPGPLAFNKPRATYVIAVLHKQVLDLLSVKASDNLAIQNRAMLCSRMLLVAPSSPSYQLSPLDASIISSKALMILLLSSEYIGT